MPSRRKERELAVQMLYQWDMNQQPVERVLDSFKRLKEKRKGTWEFARRLVKTTLEKLEEIDTLIGEHAQHWRLSRMAAVDRNVLRLAVCEFLYETTPKKVVINEALELAKKYSTPEAAQFVNGVLDAVRLEVEAASEAR